MVHPCGHRSIIADLDGLANVLVIPALDGGSGNAQGCGSFVYFGTYDAGYEDSIARFSPDVDLFDVRLAGYVRAGYLEVRL